jgi:hypothetical protein
MTALRRLRLLATVGLLVAASGAGAEEFRFSRVNGTYSNPNPELAPVQQGLVTVQLRSPKNEVHLRKNHLILRPAGGGTHAAELTVEVEGRGDLEADLGVSGMATTLVDEVVLPRQSLRLTGRIRLERVDDGYRVTAVELQPFVQLAIESKVAGTLVTACKRFALFMPVGASCDQLATSLGQAEVPLPKAGTVLILSDELLTPEDRRQLDSYLTKAGKQRSGK